MATRGRQSSFVDEVREVGSRETRCNGGNLVDIKVGGWLDLAHVHFENGRTTCLFWSVQRHLSVETPRARQGRVQDLGAVCGSQQHNTDARVKAVELGQQ